MGLSFSLKWLLAAVAYVALFVASVRYSDQPWANLVTFLTVALLLGSVVAAVYRRGAERAFWVGFGVFGWGYLLLVYGPYADQHQIGKVFGSVLTDLYPFVLREGEPIPKGTLLDGAVNYTDAGNAMVPLFGPHRADFVRFGQLTFTAVMGFVGGLFARYLSTSREREP